MISNHFWWFQEILEHMCFCWCNFKKFLGCKIIFCAVCVEICFLFYGLGFLCYCKWIIFWFGHGVPFKVFPCYVFLCAVTMIVVDIDIGMHDIFSFLSFYANFLLAFSSFYCPSPSFLTLGIVQVCFCYLLCLSHI